MWDKTFHQYTKDLWNQYDVIIMSRIDDDDFVNRFAVQDTRDVIGTRDFDMVVCGYHHGYKYFSGVDKIEQVRRFYEAGHMSVF